jgi:hypothetical protein
MTDEEKNLLIEQAMEADIRGDRETADKLLNLIPAPADLIMELKRAVGSDIDMRDVDLNFSEVVEKYGPDWYK